MVAVRCTLALLAASAVFGQTASRTFHLTTVSNPAALNEVATILRTVGDIQQIHADAVTFDITVSNGDLDLADWLVKQLDTRTPEPAEYAIPGSNDVVNILYLAHSSSTFLINEVATSLRAVADVQRLFTYTPSHGIVLRMTAAKAPLAQWMVHQMDVSPDDQNRWQPRVYSIPGNPDQEVKVMYVIHQLRQPADLNEMLSTIRTIAGLSAIFSRSQPQGIVFRGTVAQAKLGDWLFQQLDVEPDNQMRALPHEYVLPGAADGLTRVYYLSHASVKDIVDALRSELSKDQLRMFTSTQHQAVAARGAPEMMAVADRIIKEHDAAVAQ